MRTALCIVILVMASVFPQSVMPAGSQEERRPGSGYSLTELREDYRQAVETVSLRHPLFYSDKAALKKASEMHYDLLRDGMTEIEFYRLLAPVIEALKCGHSNLRISREYEDFLADHGRLLPLRVNILNGGLFVLSAIGQDGAGEVLPPGSMILSINGRDSGDIVSLLCRTVTSDGVNESGKIAKINNQFSHYYHFLVDAAGRFEVEYLGPGRERRTVSLLGIPGARFFPYGTVYSSIGLYLNFQELEQSCSGYVHPDHAYLRVGSFILGHRAFADYIESFFKETKEKKTRYLILDLRGNWGGPPISARRLFSYLIRKPTAYFNSEAPWYYNKYKRPVKPAEHCFDGEILVLTDGAVFSTAGHFVSLLRDHCRIRLIGDTTAGSAACIDASRSLKLKNTGLRLSYGTRVFTANASVSPGGSGIHPDTMVLPVIGDLLAGRDTVLGRAMEAMEAMENFRGKDGS